MSIDQPAFVSAAAQRAHYADVRRRLGGVPARPGVVLPGKGPKARALPRMAASAQDMAVAKAFRVVALFGACAVEAARVLALDAAHVAAASSERAALARRAAIGALVLVHGVAPAAIDAAMRLVPGTALACQRSAERLLRDLALGASEVSVGRLVAAMVRAGDVLTPTVTLQACVVATRQVFSLSKSEFLSDRRAHAIVVPRQAGMVVARRLTGASMPRIGKAFGGRDHTTVLHACRKMEPVIEAVAGRLAERGHIDPDGVAVEVWLEAMRDELHRTGALK
jgi:hypothetical protein